MSWSWERQLPQLGGKLVVTPADFSTSVYFPGVDRRHSGTFWTMSSGQIGQYISALDDAWDRYEKLIEVAPAGADMKAEGRMQIGIFLASWPGRGIALHKYHSIVSSRSRLDNIIAELRTLPDIATQVQNALTTVRP